MAMSTKDFEALADAISDYNKTDSRWATNIQRPFTFSQLATLADFCEEQNSRFDRTKWLARIQAGRG